MKHENLESKKLKDTNVDICPEGCKNLAAGVIERAAEDYIAAKARLKMRLSNDKALDAENTIAEVESFLLSEWCDALLSMLGCEISGRAILEELERTAK